MRIEIPVSGIVIELGLPDPDNPSHSVYGVIVEGTLKDDFSIDNYKCGNTTADAVFNGMMDALESILLAHACVGIDVTSPAYIEGLETAINACTNAV